MTKGIIFEHIIENCGRMAIIEKRSWMDLGWEWRR
jgi:hypothetical protein